MTAIKMSSRTVKRFQAQAEQGKYYSVEFAIDHPRPIYQFKIWRSEMSPMFVVVKENSAVLSKLKAGRILNMTYYSRDTHCPRKQIETRIEHITSQRQGRFEGHCTVSLIPVDQPGA